MKKLSSLAAICAAMLFVSACVGLMSAGPSIAQGGTAGKDVRVVNTAAEAVPVAVQGTPTVNVGNTPTVQVGNGPGSPVPVSVSNLPAVQSPEETFSIHTQLSIGPEQFTSPTVLAYTVPAGKRLLITYVNYFFPLAGTAQHRLEVRFPGRSFHFFDQRVFQGTGYGSEACEMSADEGETVQMSVHKDVANPPGATSFPHVYWTGHLVDMP